MEGLQSPSQRLKTQANNTVRKIINNYGLQPEGHLYPFTLILLFRKMTGFTDGSAIAARENSESGLKNIINVSRFINNSYHLGKKHFFKCFDHILCSVPNGYVCISFNITSIFLIFYN